MRESGFEESATLAENEGCGSRDATIVEYLCLL
jgi:hypothetical protein